MKLSYALLATAAATFAPDVAAAAQPALSSPDSAAESSASAASDSTDAPVPATNNGKAAKSSGGIVITGRRLDTARDAITPSLGASQYTFNQEALSKQPGGTNLTLNKSLLQAPGVVQDSYGTIHV